MFTLTFLSAYYVHIFHHIFTFSMLLFFKFIFLVEKWNLEILNRGVYVTVSQELRFYFLAKTALGKNCHGYGTVILPFPVTCLVGNLSLLGQC